MGLRRLLSITVIAAALAASAAACGKAPAAPPDDPVTTVPVRTTPGDPRAKACGAVRIPLDDLDTTIALVNTARQLGTSTPIEIAEALNEWLPGSGFYTAISQTSDNELKIALTRLWDILLVWSQRVDIQVKRPAKDDNDILAALDPPAELAGDEADVRQLCEPVWRTTAPSI